MEEYLLVIRILNYVPVKCLSKLHISSHDIMIERGRQYVCFQVTLLLIHNCICKYCDLNIIEYEENLVIFCPFFIEEREFLFQCHPKKVFFVK